MPELNTTPPAGSEARYRVSSGRCQACGAIFPAGPSRGPARRWCSEGCRWQGRKGAQAARNQELRALLEAALRVLGR